MEIDGVFYEKAQKKKKKKNLEARLKNKRNKVKRKEDGYVAGAQISVVCRVGKGGGRGY